MRRIIAAVAASLVLCAVIVDHRLDELERRDTSTVQRIGEDRHLIELLTAGMRAQRETIDRLVEACLWAEDCTITEEDSDE